MELVQELFVTAFVAVLFSFVVAKLVSLAMAGGDLGSKSSESAHKVKFMEEVKFDGGLRIQRTKSKRRVRFVDEAIEKVDKFEDEGSGHNSEESLCREVFEEKRWDSAAVCYAANRIEVGEVSDSEVVGLSGKSSEGGLREEEVAADQDVVGGNEVEGTKEEDIVTGLDGLVVEERREKTEVDEFDGVKEEDVPIAVVVEEKIVENVETDDKIVAGPVTLSDDVFVAQVEEVRDLEGGENQGIGIERELNKGDENEGLVCDEDDDWERIERSELVEVFAAAADYVACGGKDDRLSNVGGDPQMQLYGLQKVAMEGPCHEPQPMVLKVSAPAKWNECQRLGNMSPEVAMEQYITLLSDKVSGWMEGKSSCDDHNADSLESGISGASHPDISTHLHNQLNSTKERALELESGTDGGDLTGSSNSVNKEYLTANNKHWFAR